MSCTVSHALRLADRRARHDWSRAVLAEIPLWRTRPACPAARISLHPRQADLDRAIRAARMSPNANMTQSLARDKPLSGRSLLALLAIATGAIAAATGILGETAYFVPLLALVPVLVWALHDETERVRLGRRPLWVPLLLVALPFGWLLGARWVLLTQVAVCGLVVMYLALLSPVQRAVAVRRVMPVLIPAALLVGFVSLSYVLSQSVGTADVLRLVELASGLAFILLAAVYCRSSSGFERLVELIVLVAVLQLPIVVAQAIGLTNALPSALGQLNARAFGGTLASPTISVAGGSSSLGFVFRFPGSFGDYELLAECAGLALVLCVGMIVFGLGRRSRVQLLAAAFCALAVGWFTGTRSFVMASAGAVVVLLVLAVLMSGDRIKRVRRFAVGAVLLGLALIWLVPGEVTSGLLSRFVLSDASLSGPNAFNRGALFRIWWELAQKMPPLGYGTRMMEVVQASHPSFVLESPHSLYFSVLLTAGWLGLAALIALVVTVIFLAARTALSGTSADSRYWGAVLLAAALYIFVNETKIEFLRLPFYTDLVFLLFGLVAVARGLPDLEEVESGEVGGSISRLRPALGNSVDAQSLLVGKPEPGAPGRRLGAGS